MCVEWIRSAFERSFFINFESIHVERYVKMLRDRTKFLIFFEAIFQSSLKERENDFFLLNIQRIFFHKAYIKKNLERL